MPDTPITHTAALARVGELMNTISPGSPEEAEYLALLNALEAMPEEQIPEADDTCPRGGMLCDAPPVDGLAWTPRRWQIGDEERTDYQRRVDGPQGCALWLTAEEWQTVGGKWAVEVRMVCRLSTLTLWLAEGRGEGYPTPDVAMAAAEAWLAEWVAGWMPGMRCAGADLVADLDICAESLDGWISPFCGTLDRRDPDLSAGVIHAPHWVLGEVCAAVP